MKTYEEQKSFVAKLNVIDDVFFHKMAEDKEVCEEILRILLSKPNLIVIESQVQRYLRNIGAHSVILDVLCQDENGDYINVEVQKTDDDDHQRRLLFNQSNIDTTFVEKGIPYNKLQISIWYLFPSLMSLMKGILFIISIVSLKRLEPSSRMELMRYTLTPLLMINQI